MHVHSRHIDTLLIFYLSRIRSFQFETVFFFIPYDQLDIPIIYQNFIADLNITDKMFIRHMDQLFSHQSPVTRHKNNFPLLDTDRHDNITSSDFGAFGIDQQGDLI